MRLKDEIELLESENTDCAALIRSVKNDIIEKKLSVDGVTFSDHLKTIEDFDSRAGGLTILQKIHRFDKQYNSEVQGRIEQVFNVLGTSEYQNSRMFELLKQHEPLVTFIEDKEIEYDGKKIQEVIKEMEETKEKLDALELYVKDVDYAFVEYSAKLDELKARHKIGEDKKKPWDKDKDKKPEGEQPEDEQPESEPEKSEEEYPET